MPSYKYELRDTGGQVNAGVIEAGSLMDATSQLRSQGGYVINVAPLAGGAANFLDKLRSVSFEMGPGLKDVMNFTNQLAVMIKAGINIRSAIDGVCNQVDNVRFRKILERIKSDVESGKPFSDALARHPKVFSPLYINMVRASELSGNFGHMLDRITQYLGQQVETRSMVRGAMIYPTIIAVMAVVTTTFLLVFVLPTFGALFAGKDHLLPKPTMFLMNLSSFLRNQWYIVVGGLGCLISGFIYGIRTEPGGLIWDKVKLKMPLFKRMFRALYITRGLHTMGELISAGVPMLETLKITANVSGNRVYEGMWHEVHQAVKEGDKIANPLARQSLLPSSVVQMVSAGEESGNLGEVLQDVAEFYGKELRATIKAVTSMIEPLMIVIMGVVVGFIAMSVILPIFKMSSLVK